MSRLIIRQMKRGVAAGTAPDASVGAQELAKDMALGLLERSIRFGHSRLAVIRLAMAVTAGAEVPEAHWAYCREAVDGRSDDVKALFVNAVRTASIEVTTP
jgi:hypothetical protein